MLWRITRWLGALALVLFALVFIVLPLLGNTAQGRAQVEKALSRALHRDVKVGGVHFGIFWSSIDVEQLEIANPEAFPKAKFFRAKTLDLDTSLGDLLEGRVKGAVTASGLDILVQRKGGRTNLEGLGGDADAGDEEKDAADGPDLDLELELTDSRVTIEDLDKNERLVLDGVSLTMRLTDEKGKRDAGLRIRVASIDRDALSVRDLRIDARQAGDWLELDQIAALLPGAGKLRGKGRLQVAGGDEWNASLHAENVTLGGDLVPIVATLYPFAAKAGDQIAGQLDAQFELKGRGLTWEAAKPTLDGTGEVTLTSLSLPQSSLLALLAGAAGRKGGAFALNNAGAQFGVKRGWVNFNRMSASGKEARYDLAGRVSLEGKLELTMDLMPLVKLYGGGKTYRDVAKYTDKIDFRIGGTTDAPRLKGPDLEKLARGALEKQLEKGLEKELEKRLKGLFDKKK